MQKINHSKLPTFQLLFNNFKPSPRTAWSPKSLRLNSVKKIDYILET